MILGNQDSASKAKSGEIRSEPSARTACIRNEFKQIAAGMARLGRLHWFIVLLSPLF